MMNRSFKTFLFLIFYTLEVRVHASELKIQDTPLLNVPTHCFAEKKDDCLIQLKQKSVFHFEKKNSVVSMAKNSVVHFADSDSVHLVGGEYLLSDKGSLTFNMFNTKATVNGKTLVLVEEKSVKLTVLSGTTEVVILGFDKPIIMQPGYEYVFDGVSSVGDLTFEFPQPANFKTTLMRWKLFFNGSKHQFLKEARAFAGAVKVSVESSGNYFKSVVERRVANHKARLKSKARRKQRREAEDKALRDLFRKKNYL